METMRFDPKWVAWIKECFSSVLYLFIVNGKHVGMVIPSRGLRQGIPLSLYLFLLVSKGLSTVFMETMANREISGLAVAENCPRISDLLFTNDSLLFLKAITSEVECLLSILQDYETTSDQFINLEKSTIIFSQNLGLEMK